MWKRATPSAQRCAANIHELVGARHECLAALCAVPRRYSHAVFDEELPPAGLGEGCDVARAVGVSKEGSYQLRVATAASAAIPELRPHLYADPSVDFQIEEFTIADHMDSICGDLLPVQVVSTPSDPVAIIRRPIASQRTETPFADEVPRILHQRGMSLRALAREVGVADSHLSRALRRVNYKRASPELVERVSVALGFPPDYFPEVREARVVAAVRADPKLRNDLYDRLKRRRPPKR